MRPEPQADDIDRALRACAAEVDRVGRWRWQMALVNGQVLTIDVQAHPRWLGFRTPLKAVDADPLRLLSFNHRLEGASRIAREDNGGLIVRSDVLVTDPSRLSVRIREAWEGMAQAATRLLTGGGEIGSARGGSVPDAAELRERGWHTSTLDDGAIGVALDVPGAFRQARCEPIGDGGCEIAVDLLCWVDVDLPMTCRSTVARLLLAAADRARFVRPAVAGPKAQARFETRFTTAPSTDEVDESLRALAAACRLYGNEIESMADPALAAAVRQWVRETDVSAELAAVFD